MNRFGGLVRLGSPSDLRRLAVLGVFLDRTREVRKSVVVAGPPRLCFLARCGRMLAPEIQGMPRLLRCRRTRSNGVDLCATDL